MILLRFCLMYNNYYRMLAISRLYLIFHMVSVKINVNKIMSNIQKWSHEASIPANNRRSGDYLRPYDFFIDMGVLIT
jgi:hypothetical protein